MSNTDPEAVAVRLRYTAQNNEMIDQHYTESGELMNEAADLIEALALDLASCRRRCELAVKRAEKHHAGDRAACARLAAAEKVVEAAREDLIWIREAASSGVLHPASGSEVADALAAYDKQKGGDGMSDDWEHDEPTNDDDDMWPEPHAERIEELRQRNFRRENEPTVAALQAKLDAVKRSVKDQLATDAGPWRDGGCSCEVCELARAILATIEGEKEPNTTEPT